MTGWALWQPLSGLAAVVDFYRWSQAAVEVSLIGGLRAGSAEKVGQPDNPDQQIEPSWMALKSCALLAGGMGARGLAIGRIGIIKVSHV